MIRQKTIEASSIDKIIDQLHGSDLSGSYFLLLLGIYEILIAIAYKLDCVKEDTGGGKNL